MRLDDDTTLDLDIDNDTYSVELTMSGGPIVYWVTNWPEISKATGITSFPEFALKLRDDVQGAIEKAIRSTLEQWERNETG